MESGRRDCWPSDVVDGKCGGWGLVLGVGAVSSGLVGVGSESKYHQQENIVSHADYVHTHSDEQGLLYGAIDSQKDPSYSKPSYGRCQGK